MSTMTSQTPETRLFVQQLARVDNKEPTKPHTKGQKIHGMTSSYKWAVTWLPTYRLILHVLISHPAVTHLLTIWLDPPTGIRAYKHVAYIARDYFTKNRHVLCFVLFMRIGHSWAQSLIQWPDKFSWVMILIHARFTAQFICHKIQLLQFYRQYKILVYLISIIKTNSHGKYIEARFFVHYKSTLY